MYTHFVRLRVRYAETDRMGYAYYGNYATYLEVARVETLRELGISYRSLEDEGILLPVLEYSVKFHKPALYDDELLIRTVIPTLPGVRIKFDYAIFRGEELLNTASTELVFVDRATGRPVRCPAHILKSLRPHF